MILLLATLFAAAAQAADLPPPGAPLLTPNGVVTADRPLHVEVDGLPQGTVLYVRVYQNCTGGAVFDPRYAGSCEAALGPFEPLLDGGVQSRVADDGVARGSLSLAQLGEVQTGRPLWLVARGGTDGPPGPPTRFAVGGDECSLLGAFVDGWGGACALLPPINWPTLGSEEDSTLGRGVVWLAERGSSVRAPVPGTEWATGVAWEGPDTLLVTLDPETASASAGPGLYRVPLQGGAPELVRAAAEGERLHAPAASGGRWAVTARREGEDVVILGKGRRALATWTASGQVQEILGISTEHVLVWQVRAGEDEVMVLDLNGRAVEALPWCDELLATLRRGPEGALLLPWRDRGGAYGWELSLFDASGQPLEDIHADCGLGTDEARGCDERGGAWQPGGGRYVWLEMRTPPSQP